MLIELEVYLHSNAIRTDIEVIDTDNIKSIGSYISDWERVYIVIFHRPIRGVRDRYILAKEFHKLCKHVDDSILYETLRECYWRETWKLPRRRISRGNKRTEAQTS